LKATVGLTQIEAGENPYLARQLSVF
jgi:hypothetical protein